MAESNATQVILTDDGIKIIKAQNTADNAASGITNLNDPNLMSVIEKQNNIAQFAGLTSQYNVLVQNARDDGIDTTAVTTAYNNLNKFMAGVLADPDHASDVDRVTYKKYQDAYNGELAKLQNALQNNANDKFTSAASATSQAASTASQAFSKAQAVGNQASAEIAVQSTATVKAHQSAADNAFSKATAVGSQASKEIAVQSTATAKAQSKADDAFSKATAAIDNGKVTSQTVTDLKDGSKLTIADLENGLATKVANSDYASYKDQTASQIGQMVTNGVFSAYQQTTKDLISSKVATKDFSAYQATTAKSIGSKVESRDFNSYKQQTDNAILSKVANKDFSTYKTQTAGLIESKVDNGTFSSYKTETADLIASKVATKDFSTYQKQTADLISEKVATKDFSAYQATTAKAISSKVESKDFNTYKTQTADVISSKVSKKDANNVNLIPYSSNFSDSLEGWQLMAWGATDRKLLAVTHNFYKNGTEKLLYLNTAQNAISAAGSLRFSVLPNTKYTFQFKAFASSNVVGANVYFLSRAYGSTKDYDTVHGLFNNLVTSPAHIDQYTVTFTTGANDNEGYIRVDNIGSNNGSSSGLFFTELKMEPGDTATNYIYGGQDSMISQMSNDIILRVTKDELIDQINLQAGNTLISSSGQLTLSGKNVFLDSDNPVIMKSANIDTLLVGKKLTAADISANTFSTNNRTFTVDSNGAITAKNMTLIGGTLSSPTINASTINGSTINGTTFHGGDIINSANNTAKYYPMTITPDGAYKSTYFDSAVGLQSSVESGAISYKYRSMIGSGQYLAYDSVINGQGFESQSGYTSAKDTTFSNPETITGYVNVTPASGIYLYGPTQKINFAGNADNIGSNGITMDAYGNIYAQANSSYWRIRDINSNDIVDFGIDTAGANNIFLHRELDIGNFHINTGHTFTSADNGAIHFAKGKGGAADIYAGAVRYTSLVKSSLLSR
ncbi:tail fiber [Lactiplantibacillus plantarum]|nr:cell envelope integrity protein TolA [Lactiplantibacillus plantarum]VDH12528.1 tail fiber [Lactiplantibacillus plantarum]